MEVVVLRLYHRPDRDKRVTTHVALVARAFGANKIIIDGEDPKLLETIKKVNKNWGNLSFSVEFTNSPKDVVRKYKESGYKVVHLTMYGLNIGDFFPKKELNKVLIIVGSEKVERWYYENADYNLAVGNQPHSEVSALALFLDRLFDGMELKTEFPDATYKIIPQERGKKVERIK